jgi:hypothetical protein
MIVLCAGSMMIVYNRLTIGELVAFVSHLPLISICRTFGKISDRIRPNTTALHANILENAHNSRKPRCWAIGMR